MLILFVSRYGILVKSDGNRRILLTFLGTVRFLCHVSGLVGISLLRGMSIDLVSNDCLFSFNSLDFLGDLLSLR